MKEKIKAALKTSFAGLGLSEEVFEGVADAFAGTNLITDENLETALAGAKPALQKYAAELDRRVNTYKAENEKLKNENGGGKPAEPNKGKKSDDEPEWAKELRESNKALLEKVSAFETEKTAGELQKHVTQTLGTKVPSWFTELQLDGRKFNNKEEAEAFAAKIEASYTTHATKISEQALQEQSEKPFHGGQPGASNFLDMMQVVGKTAEKKD